MTFTKTVMILATAGFLAACEEGASTGGGGSAAAGGNDPSLIRDGGLVGKLDSSAANGNTVIYSYYTEVIGDGPVLNGADTYCGGAGQAVLNQEGLGVVKGTKNGRGFNTMTFICR